MVIRCVSMTNYSDDRPGGDDSKSGKHDEAGSSQSQADASNSDSGADSADGERHGRRRGRHHHRRHGHHGRKERVLHTRISEQLSDDIRRLAEDLRVPTSNLVRNVLEEVFTVVESVTDDVGGIFEEVLDEAEGARERIRRRSRDRASRPSEGARRESRRSSWADVAEEEIRSDEEREGHPSRAPGAAADAEPAREPEAREVPPRPAFDEVVGWQPLILNQTQECARCGHSIRRGSRAFVGQTEQGLSRIALCRQCLRDD
jgi:hypothetical protein